MEFWPIRTKDLLVKLVSLTSLPRLSAIWDSVEWNSGGTDSIALRILSRRSVVETPISVYLKLRRPMNIRKRN